ncbi:hypothetical protein [Shimia sp. FJ5]|uniref:hypothetical protein n=1 Tax=Shimia sp. FJ5 TaxID=3079054 RepID=UPI00262BA352|nr:hypothetical protein [Shimia sp. FJ5]MDV4145573.1 hypothetical protein [Shimia sp. FJ5]
MTTPHPPTGEPTLDREIAQLRQLLFGLSDAVGTLQTHLRRGDRRAIAQCAPLVRDLRGLVRLALDTETRFDTYRTEDRGRAGAPKLALDSARDQIGRRLDRLRAAEDAGGIS